MITDETKTRLLGVIPKSLIFRLMKEGRGKIPTNHLTHHEKHHTNEKSIKRGSDNE